MPPIVRRGVIHLLALLTAVNVCANAAAQPAQDIATTSGLGISAETRAPGVFTIAIAPTDATTAADAVELTAAGWRLRLAPSGEITVSEPNNATPCFEASLHALQAYGRANVPGVALRWRMADDEAIYGLGERFNGLDQAGRRVAMWILDSPGAGDGARDSYFCTPVVYSSRGYGLFATDNPEGEFDFNTAGDGWARYQRAGRTLTFYLVFKDTLRELVATRGALQGPFRGVPDWAWGPWISRNSYEHQREAVAVIEEMTRRGWPVAAIVQEAWKGRSERGEFNWFSDERWPDLDAYFALCAKHDIKTILWQVPILHPSSPHFETGRRRGVFVDTPSGEISFRKQWLAGFANLDFTDPNAIALWHELLTPALQRGAYGFKADDGEDIKATDVFADGRRGWQMHNEYSVLYNQSLFDLFDALGVDGLLWARSGSLGIERTPALWAGDQHPTWEQLRGLLGAGLSASLSGAPFWGHDIGGYFGTPTPELYIRWLQFGTFSPLMQYHGQTPREPWAFGAEAETAYDLLVQVRTALRPLLVELGREAAATGMPIMRPMALEFPDDPRFVSEDSQYMLGPDLLVAPVTEPNVAGRVVLFPAGRWQHLLHPTAYDGPTTASVPIELVDAPVFVRSDTVLPIKLLAAFNAQRVDDTHISFPRARALLRKLDIPAEGDILAGEVHITFGAEADVAQQVVCTHQPGGGNAPTRLKLEEREGRYQFTLPGGAPGRTDAFALRLQRDGDTPRLLAAGHLRWQTPLSLAIEADRTLAEVDQPLAVRTRVRNTARRAVTVQVTLDGGGAFTLTEDRAEFEVPPSVEVTRDWTIVPRRTLGAGGALLRARLTAGHGHDETQTLHLVPAWRWVVVGPFAAEPARTQCTLFGPEWHVTPTTGFYHAGTTLIWKHLPPQSTLRHPGIDLGAAFDHQQHAVGCAMTRLTSPRDCDIVIHYGSDDTLALWLNGELLDIEQDYGDAQPDQQRLAARLRHGVNTLVLRSGQETGAWLTYVRITDADGRPLTDLRDGFSDYADFSARREVTQTIPSPALPLAWELAGPFSPRSDPLAEADFADLAEPNTAWPPSLSQGIWRMHTPPTADGVIDLKRALGPPDNVVAYAATTLHVARDTPAELVCGSDDGVTVWLNGARVIHAPQPRGFKHDSNRAAVTLRAGENRLLAKIRQTHGDWAFRIAVWDTSARPARPLNAR